MQTYLLQLIPNNIYSIDIIESESLFLSIFLPTYSGLPRPTEKDLDCVLAPLKLQKRYIKKGRLAQEPKKNSP